MAEIDESTQAEITQAFAAFSESWQRNVVAPIRQALASIEKMMIQACGTQPSSRRRRPRNTRVQRVQAKRKALKRRQNE